MPPFARQKENGPTSDKKRMLPKIPKINTNKLKGSLKCLSWIQRKIKSRGALFPVLMIFINGVYLTLGGLIFMALEKTPKSIVNSSQELAELINTLKKSNIGNLTLKPGISGSDVVANLSLSDLSRIEGVLTQISEGRAAAAKSEWTIMNSIFFCMTVMTTIGYGHLSPKTVLGRVICVIYALLGIPLALALLAVIGKFIGDYINHGVGIFLKGLKKCCPDHEYDGRNDDNSEMDAPLWLALLFLAVFMSIMAFVYCYIEGWDFGTAFYFTFVTFLTIGFGDVVPEEESLVFLNIFLTFLGLSFLSITLSLIASNLVHQMQKAAFLAKEQELSDMSNAGYEGDGESSSPQTTDSFTEDKRPFSSDNSNETKSYGSTSESP